MFWYHLSGRKNEAEILRWNYGTVIMLPTGTRKIYKFINHILKQQYKVY